MGGGTRERSWNPGRLMPIAIEKDFTVTSRAWSGFWPSSV